MSIVHSDNVKIIDTVGVTTTSGAYDISNRQIVSIQFVTTGGSSIFTIDASNDGTNWDTGVGFLDAGATATGTSIVTSGALSSTNMIAVVNPVFRYIRVVATWTSGTASAILEAKG